MFARDPDALVDLTVASVTSVTGAAALMAAHGRGARAFVASFTLREFAGRPPLGVIWDYPRHYVDGTGEIAACPLVGSTGEARATDAQATAEKARAEWAGNRGVAGEVRTRLIYSPIRPSKAEDTVRNPESARGAGPRRRHGPRWMRGRGLAREEASDGHD